MFKICYYFCFIWNIVCYFVAVNGDDTVADVKKSVLKDYDPSLPPTLFATSPHFIFVNFKISRIRGLDEKRGEFFIEGTLVMAWIDTRLFWESRKVTEFPVHQNEIWMPSLYVYNAVEPEEITSEPLPIVSIGGAYWGPRYNIRTSCNINLRYYPFDKHVCDVIIASRSKVGDFFTSAVPIFYATSIQTSRMIENPLWTHFYLKSFQKKMKINSDSPELVLVYRFSFQRTMPLIPLSILTPCLSCSLLLLTTFWMQPNNTTRAGLCIIATLVSTSSLFTLGRLLPASGSSTPIIVEYVSITLILAVLSSVQTIVSSVMRRCEKLPPISYTMVESKIPLWCLWLMGISPQKTVVQQLEQRFLFSELEDTEKKGSSGREEHTEEDNPKIDEDKSEREKIIQEQCVRSIWIKFSVLIDRIMFYVLLLVIILFIISVIITE